MCALLLLFVLVPVIELALLLRLGELIGLGPTIALILVTGTLGAFLARWQGLGVLERMRAETRAGRIPADSVSDGVLILLAGAVLITPGVLTDVFGFLCLVPAFRRWLKGVLRRRFERAVREGRVQVRFHADVTAASRPGRPGERVVDVEAREIGEGGSRGGDDSGTT